MAPRRVGTPPDAADDVDDRLRLSLVDDAGAHRAFRVGAMNADNSGQLLLRSCSLHLRGRNREARDKLKADEHAWTFKARVNI